MRLAYLSCRDSVSRAHSAGALLMASRDAGEVSPVIRPGVS